MAYQPEMMKCDWCGREFPADARACTEAGFVAGFEAEEGEEWKGEQPISLSPDQLSPGHRKTIKAELGLDDAQLEELLRTGKVEGLGAIVCLECQEAGLEADD